MVVVWRKNDDESFSDQWRCSEDRENHAGPALLHDHRYEVRVGGPGIEKFFDHVGMDLRIHVVDVRLDDDHLFARAFIDLADDDPQEVRDLRDLPRPGAVADAPRRGSTPSRASPTTSRG